MGINKKQKQQGDFWDRHPYFPLCISIISLVITIAALIIKIAISK